MSAINADNKVTRGRGLDHLFDPMCKCGHSKGKHAQLSVIGSTHTFCCDIDCCCPAFEITPVTAAKRRWKDLLK